MFWPLLGLCGGSELKGPGESTGGCGDLLRSSMPRTSTLEVFSLWNWTFAKGFFGSPLFFFFQQKPLLPSPFLFPCFGCEPHIPTAWMANVGMPHLGGGPFTLSFSLFFSTWIFPWMWGWGAATAPSLCGCQWWGIHHQHHFSPLLEQ